jgi:hypothetical protein
MAPNRKMASIVAMAAKSDMASVLQSVVR